MPPILLGEYKNQNSHRNYPFADDMTLTDDTGQKLSTDFLVDALIYPIDLTGGVYISSIDLETHIVYLSDTITQQVIGICDFTDMSTVQYVYEPVGTYERKIGTMVFGDGLPSVFQGSKLRNFTSEATALVPTAFIPMNQKGVRGILLPDGTLITDYVVFRGEEGITVTSFVDSTVNVIRFDIVGVRSPDVEACIDLPPLITTICIERVKGSAIQISDWCDATVALEAFDMTLDDICAAKKARTLPDVDGKLPAKDYGDVCDPPIPPIPPVVPDDPCTICTEAATVGPTFFIVAPSVSGEPPNAVTVKQVNQNGATERSRFIQRAPVADISELATALQQFTNPPSLAESIQISLRGVRAF